MLVVDKATLCRWARDNDRHPAGSGQRRHQGAVLLYVWRGAMLVCEECRFVQNGGDASLPPHRTERVCRNLDGHAVVQVDELGTALLHHAAQDGRGVDDAADIAERDFRLVTVYCHDADNATLAGLQLVR